MKSTTLCLLVTLAATPCAAICQSSSSTVELASAESNTSPASADSNAGSTRGTAITPTRGAYQASAPFARFGFGVSLSPLGIGLQTATNINDHLNLRGTGSFFNYNTSFTTSGFTANAKLNLASAGAALDYYPTHLGFRVSPGVLFYNNNGLTAADTVAGGTSFTLNGDTFYSANANSATGATPANGNASLALNTTKPAFTLTTGWGNLAPRSGRHISFPFEIGAAFTGSPSLNANLAGWACHDQAQTQCVDLSSSNPIALEVQSDLKAQIAKWTSDLSPLKVYPILSVGVGYSFNVRRAR
ncbi:MAG TPA: hypothetical protein VLZ50_10720 [Terracidiphilus sp.]|nr:hypothetical protein [Terracidiphilus sp.]